MDQKTLIIPTEIDNTSSFLKMYKLCLEISKNQNNKDLDIFTNLINQIYEIDSKITDYINNYIKKKI